MPRTHTVRCNLLTYPRFLSPQWLSKVEKVRNAAGSSWWCVPCAGGTAAAADARGPRQRTQGAQFDPPNPGLPRHRADGSEEGSEAENSDMMSPIREV